MSTPVEIGDLQRALADFDSGYLLTTTDGRIKAVTVDPRYDDGGLSIIGPGHGTLRNLAENPSVTLVFPPAEPKGYSLLVDGRATIAGDDVRVVPETAVLHRPRAHATGAVADDGCGHDCVPV